MRKGNVFWLVFTLVLFVSCKHSPLEEALQKAGENRMELQQVLDYFSSREEDSLKYEAARFLIENMPGHFSYADAVSWNTLTDKLPADENRWAIGLYARMVYQHRMSILQSESMKMQEDIKTLKADFLIRHIESVFRQRDSLSWMQDVAFDDFCEYVLPYKIRHEIPFLWRDSILRGVNRTMECYRMSNNARTSMLSLSEQLYYMADIDWNRIYDVLPVKRNGYRTDCVDIASRDLLVRRLAGIPSAIDMTPCWGNYNGQHEWMQPIDRCRRHTAQLEKFNRFTLPKVYRYTYSSRTVCKNTDEYIPPLFADGHWKDVTSEYLNTHEVMEKGFPYNATFGYLCVFHRGEWIPVAQSAIRFGKCAFADMGAGVVYLPVYYNKENMLVPVAHPFLLKNTGDKEYFRPSMSSTEQLSLNRKYPLPNMNFIHPSKHLTLLASPDKNFRECDTLKADLSSFMQPYKTTLRKPCRYFRVLSTELVSEFYFYNSQGERLLLSVADPDNRGDVYQDNNVLTYGQARSIQFSLKDDSKGGVTSVGVLFFYDGNGIYPGDEYELFYFDKEKQWVSCGYKTADDFSITFEDVPQGALYWLQNLTTGKEERVFTIENGRQCFW